MPCRKSKKLKRKPKRKSKPQMSIGGMTTKRHMKLLREQRKAKWKRQKRR